MRETPPHDEAAEVAVLGAAMLDADAMAKCLELLRPEDYYHTAHRLIHRAMADVATTGRQPDMLAVCRRLDDMGALDQAGGRAYISQIAGDAWTAANLEAHAEIISNMAARRDLIASAGRLVELAHDLGAKIPEILDTAERSVCDIGNRRVVADIAPISQIVAEVYDETERLSESTDPPGISTGLIDLDKKIGGLNRSDLIILAARPSMGKTALAINMACNAASHGSPVIVFSMEMNRRDIARRMLANEARITGSALKLGKIEDRQWGDLARAVGRVGSWPMWIDDTSVMDAQAMRARCRRVRIDAGRLGLVVVDYIGLMDATGAENRTQEVSKISKGLKRLAREFDCPVLALSQLSRAVEQRTDKRPMLSDLRESGSIEQDADIVLFIYRDEYYNPETDAKNTAEINVAKQRQGETGIVHTYWDGPHTAFRDLARF